MRRFFALIGVCAGVVFALFLLNPAPALAWGPVTHIELGVQVLASVIGPGHTLQALLASLPEAFLYGGLAPDIVQGRRLHSRLRRHSHNWSTGVALLDAARNNQERSFAYGYLAHLAADVVAHNFFLPARFAGHYNEGSSSHIYNEACFDTLCDLEYSELLLTLLDLDVSTMDAMLERAIDSPMPFSAHRMIFEGGLRRIREWHQVILATGGKQMIPASEAALFKDASRDAISGVLMDPHDASCCRFDPMGSRAIRRAVTARRYMQRLAGVGPESREAAAKLSASILADVLDSMRQAAFIKTT